MGAPNQVSFWMMLTSLPRRPLAPIITIGGFILLCFAFFTYRSHDAIAEHVQQEMKWVQGKHHTTIKDVKNETLGVFTASSTKDFVLTLRTQFQKIFVIGLPERTDKRDSLSLAASFSGIDFEWIDGVQGKEIPSKAHPLGWNEEESNATLGCWRAHMNVAQK